MIAPRQQWNFASTVTSPLSIDRLEEEMRLSGRRTQRAVPRTLSGNVLHPMLSRMIRGGQGRRDDVVPDDTDLVPRQLPID